MKSYTDLQQSKKLAEILPLESADMIWVLANPDLPMIKAIAYEDSEKNKYYEILPAWSLAALLEELNRNCWKVSLKCCGAEWDMTYDDGERYISVSADYAIDACYEMIIKLHELKML